MSTLITGGTGFIGAELVRMLLENGESDLTVLHRSSSVKRLQDVVDRINFIQGDLGNFSHVLDAVKEAQPDVIFHLGAMLSVPSEADPPAAIQTNAMGTFHLLEAARLFEVPQVLYTSSLASYGADIQEPVIDDTTLQRPQLIYGVTKLFGEHLGLFYKRKYGLDFRGIRYPSIIGPGVKTPGVVQYTSWVIEESARGNPFTINVGPETRVPVMYFKDAARAVLRLSEAPVENVKSVNYLVDGVRPTPSAEELVNGVRQKVPGAQIEFQPDPQLQALLDRLLRPLDDSRARQEWGWQPRFDLAATIDDFLVELENHPQRYT